jgi:hypothetical protein
VTRSLVFGALVVHGLGHVGAIGALMWRALVSVDAADRSGWLAPRSWLLPWLDLPSATLVAYGCWLMPAVGFTVAALLFWFGLPSEPPQLELWRFVALAAAVVSLVGLLTFFGTWPWFNTVAALSVNVVVIVTQLFMRWPTTRALGG